MPSISAHRPTGDSMSPNDESGLDHWVRGCDGWTNTSEFFCLALGYNFSWKGLQLDRTIDRIGMGSYQLALLSLCGFSDFLSFTDSSFLLNESLQMWLQVIAIILPRVQQHYADEPTVELLTWSAEHVASSA
jgi:hypothetical protein